VPGFEASNFNGFGAPKNTPAEIVAKLNREINATLADCRLAPHPRGRGAGCAGRVGGVWRARKIRRKLCGDPMGIRYPRKPPRMPQAKYDQPIDKLAAAESIVEDAANGRMFAGLARLERLTGRL
jgi:hypothetical protein